MQERQRVIKKQNNGKKIKQKLVSDHDWRCVHEQGKLNSCYGPMHVIYWGNRYSEWLLCL